MTWKRQQITMEEGDSVIINTPTGQITIFHGKYYRCITSYAKDMCIDAFYTEGATKETTKPFVEGANRLVCIKPKKEE